MSTFCTGKTVVAAAAVVVESGAIGSTSGNTKGIMNMNHVV